MDNGLDEYAEKAQEAYMRQKDAEELKSMPEHVRGAADRQAARSAIPKAEWKVMPKEVKRQHAADFAHDWETVIHPYLVDRAVADIHGIPKKEQKPALDFYPGARKSLDLYHATKHGFTPAQQLLAKTVVAFTSGNQTPHDNFVVAHRMISEGKARNPESPFLGIPALNERGFDRWKERIGDRHIPLTGHKNNIDFFHQYLAGHPDLHGEVGYYGVPARMDSRTGRIVSYDQNGKRVLHGIYPHLYEHLDSQRGRLKNVLLPTLDESGSLTAKNWSMRGNIIKPNLEKLQKLVAVLGEEGAAKFLLSSHKKKLFPISYTESGKKRTTKNGYIAVGGHLPGSWIFGPKFGAYTQNLHGRLEHLTQDLWFARTMGRYLGKGADSTAPEGDPERRRFYRVMQEVAEKTGLPVAQAQSVLWHMEQKRQADAGLPISTSSYQDGVDTVEGDRFRLARVQESLGV